VQLRQVSSTRFVEVAVNEMMNSLAPMIVMVTAIVTTGGVILLRPLAKRAGDLLEVMALERRSVLNTRVPTQLEETLGRVDARLAQLEERQDFADQLLNQTNGRAAAVPAHPTAPKLPRGAAER
jgi:hypothetical protein